MIAQLLDFSVRNSRLVVLASAILLLCGVLTLPRLPIDAVPDITNNQVQITAVAPWLSPQDMERQVTFPLETALAGAPGLESTRSLSRNGFAQITAVFSEQTDIYFARQQVAERLREARGALPAGVEPRLGPISTGLGEIYMWTLAFAPPPADLAEDPPAGWRRDGSFATPDGQILRGAGERAAFLRQTQDWMLRPQIKAIAGVAGVDSIGGEQKIYQIQPDVTRLLAAGLSFADLAAALEANNANRGAGFVERNGEALAVRALGRLESLEDIENVVIAARGGAPIRVGDVARVAMGVELRSGSASAQGEEVVLGSALMRIGANSREVAAAVDARIAELARNLPPGLALTPVLNRSALVDATIATVTKNLAEGAVLVAAVLLLMLGNLRAALIAALVIPFAMVMTLSGMAATRVSANLMSLGALDFGLIVDGAIIIAENALRRLAERRQALGRALSRGEREQSVAAAAREMITPSLYGQAIIILVYVPLLSFSGVEGKMFHPMALTVMMALAAAFVLSVTLVPALIALALPAPADEREAAPMRLLRRLYAPALDAALARPLTLAGGASLLALGALLLFGRLGQQFMPVLDEGDIAMNVQRIPSIALSQSQAMQSQVERLVAGFPEVRLVFSRTGTAEIASDPMPVNSSDAFIMLKPRREWPDPGESKAALQARIAGAVERLPGDVFEYSQPIQLRFNELLAGARGDLAIKIFGDDFEVMGRIARQIAALLRETRGAEDVKVEQIAGLPMLEIVIDKAAASRYGLSVAAVQEVIGAAVGGRELGHVYEGERRFPLTLRLGEASRSDIETLKNLPLPLPLASPRLNGPAVLMKEVARFEEREGPNQISRENGQRRVVVTANLRGRDMGSVVEEARARAEAEVALPPGYRLHWGGQYENLAAAKARLALVTPACFALILLLLYGALGRWRDALLAFGAVPLALTGGVAALWLAGEPFSVSAAVGFIALSGVAVLNGLVLLSAISRLRAAGRSRREAVREGALARLRPVAMTALVAALGFAPMALATGAGAEVQKPLAIVVIGGLISATLLTLLALPALYLRLGGEEEAPR